MVKWLGTIIVVLVGVCSSCTTPKKITYEQSTVVKDSLWIKRSYVDTLVKVPPSYASLVINPSIMREGEEVKEHSGQATVSIKKEGEKVLVTATCDSLEQVIKILQEELFRVSNLQDDVKQETVPTISRTQWFSYGFLAGICSIIIIFIIILIIKRK